MRPALILAAVAIVVAIVAVLVLKRAPADPEQQVRATLAQAVSAAEAQDLSGLMGLVSKRFESPELDRDAIRGILFVELRRGVWRRVYLVDTKVEILAGNKSARVKTGAVLTGGDRNKKSATPSPGCTAPDNAVQYAPSCAPWLVNNADSDSGAVPRCTGRHSTGQASPGVVPGGVAWRA